MPGKDKGFCVGFRAVATLCLYLAQAHNSFLPEACALTDRREMRTNKKINVPLFGIPLSGWGAWAKGTAAPIKKQLGLKQRWDCFFSGAWGVGYFT
jgi:hypothetical protein